MSDIELKDLTTLRVGGPAGRFVDATTRDELIAAALDADAQSDEHEPWLLLAGGSNLVVQDGGVPGTVVRASTQGIEVLAADEGGTWDDAAPDVLVRVQAGHEWDDLVAWSVDEGLAGLEALSGIPGRAGAAPIQNIGAYGGEVGDTLRSIELLDLDSGEVRRIPASGLDLGYRSSALKSGSLRGVVLSIDLGLRRDGGLSAPVAYQQLASALGVTLGERAPLTEVREAVLRTRAAKGMVLSDDPDSVSAGSFFTNPIVSEGFARGLPDDAPRFAVDPEPIDRILPLDPAALDAALHTPWPSVEPRIKLSAAWLIERAGIERGFHLPGSKAAISSKHTLAITNRGGSTAAEILQLAGFVQLRVENTFGVRLEPEPTVVGVPRD